MSKLDSRSVLTGTLITLVIVIPVMVIAQVAKPADGTSSGWGDLYLGVILVATFVGSAAAGRRQRSTPALHGAAAAVASFVIAQLVATVVRAELPNPFGLAFFALAFACVGAVAGMVGTLQVFERDEPDEPHEGTAP